MLSVHHSTGVSLRQASEQQKVKSSAENEPKSPSDQHLNSGDTRYYFTRWFCTKSDSLMNVTSRFTGKIRSLVKKCVFYGESGIRSRQCASMKDFVETYIHPEGKHPDGTDLSKKEADKDAEIIALYDNFINVSTLGASSENTTNFKISGIKGFIISALYLLSRNTASAKHQNHFSLSDRIELHIENDFKRYILMSPNPDFPTEYYKSTVTYPVPENRSVNIQEPINVLGFNGKIYLNYLPANLNSCSPTILTNCLFTTVSADKVHQASSDQSPCVISIPEKKQGIHYYHSIITIGNAPYNSIELTFRINVEPVHIVKIVTRINHPSLRGETSHHHYFLGYGSYLLSNSHSHYKPNNRVITYYENSQISIDVSVLTSKTDFAELPIIRCNNKYRDPNLIYKEQAYACRLYLPKNNTGVISISTQSKPEEAIHFTATPNTILMDGSTPEECKHVSEKSLEKSFFLAGGVSWRHEITDVTTQDSIPEYHKYYLPFSLFAGREWLILLIFTVVPCAKRVAYKISIRNQAFFITNLNHQPKEEEIRLAIFNEIKKNDPARADNINRLHSLAEKLSSGCQTLNPCLIDIVRNMLIDPSIFNITDNALTEASDKYKRLVNTGDRGNVLTFKRNLSTIYKTTLFILMEIIANKLKASDITINFPELDITVTHYLNIWGRKNLLTNIVNRFYMRNRDLAEKEYLLNQHKQIMQQADIKASHYYRPTQNTRPTYGALNYNNARHGAAPCYGAHFAKLTSSIKEKTVYTLSHTVFEKTKGIAPPPTHNLETLVLNLMESTHHGKLLNSIVESIFMPRKHCFSVHEMQTTFETCHYIECLLFDNIDIRKHFSEVRFFSDKCSFELERFIRFKSEGKIPFNLYIDEHKIPENSHGLLLSDSAKDKVNKAIAKAVTNKIFRRLYPEDDKIKNMKEYLCPISYEPLKECKSILSYNINGTDLYYSEESIIRMVVFSGKMRCPITSKILFSLKNYGPCPSGTMKINIITTPENETIQGVCKFYEITYTIYPGFQSSLHAKPGIRHEGTIRTAYLPHTEEGAKICKMLRKAFVNRQTFTVGQSITTLKKNVVVWNDIHHKTALFSGPYALAGDPFYLTRVRDEIERTGIKYPEIVPENEKLTTFLDNMYEERQTNIQEQETKALMEFNQAKPPAHSPEPGTSNDNIATNKAAIA